MAKIAIRGFLFAIVYPFHHDHFGTYNMNETSQDIPSSMSEAVITDELIVETKP